MKGPEEWVLGPGHIMEVPTAHSHQRRFVVHKPTWKDLQKTPKPYVEITSECAYCGHYGMHYMLRITEKVITEERSHLNDQLQTETKYRKVRARLLTRQCSSPDPQWHCQFSWYEIINQQPGTWYRVGDA